MNSLFRQQAPSSADLDSFHNDGYVYYPNVLTAEGREKLIEEILRIIFRRPWNDRGPLGRGLIVYPFVTALLSATAISRSFPAATSSPRRYFGTEIAQRSCDRVSQLLGSHEGHRRRHGEGDRQKRPKHQEYLGQTYTRLTTMAPYPCYPLCGECRLRNCFASPT